MERGEEGSGERIAGAWPRKIQAYSGATSAAFSILDTALTLPSESVAGETITTRILAMDMGGRD